MILKIKTKIFFLFIVTIMIMGITPAQSLPNGKGLQLYNTGVGSNDQLFIKGVPFHAFFGFEDLTVKVGTWVTITFGVNEFVDTLDNLDEVLATFPDFLDDFDWSGSFDGFDFVDTLLVGRYDSPIIVEIEEGLWSVVVRYVFYINPQSVGCYEYSLHLTAEDFELGRDNLICWLPQNMI